MSIEVSISGEKPIHWRHVFDLREIYHEIELDLQRGYALVQPDLWQEVS